MRKRPIVETFRLLAVAILLLCPAALTASESKTAFEPLPRERLDRAQMEQARHTANDLLKSWSQGKFQPLSDEFTQAVRDSFTPDAQQGAYRSIRNLFGDFCELSFVEAFTIELMPEIVIYRFRGSFGKDEERPEVRVVMTDTGKIAGFFVKPWKDKLP